MSNQQITQWTDQAGNQWQWSTVPDFGPVLYLVVGGETYPMLHRDPDGRRVITDFVDGEWVVVRPLTDAELMGHAVAFALMWGDGPDVAAVMGHGPDPDEPDADLACEDGRFGGASPADI